MSCLSAAVTLTAREFCRCDLVGVWVCSATAKGPVSDLQGGVRGISHPQLGEAGGAAQAPGEAAAELFSVIAKVPPEFEYLFN